MGENKFDYQAMHALTLDQYNVHVSITKDFLQTVQTSSDEFLNQTADLPISITTALAFYSSNYHWDNGVIEMYEGQGYTSILDEILRRHEGMEFSGRCLIFHEDASDPDTCSAETTAWFGRILSRIPHLRRIAWVRSENPAYQILSFYKIDARNLGEICADLLARSPNQRIAPSQVEQVWKNLLEKSCYLFWIRYFKLLRMAKKEDVFPALEYARKQISDLLGVPAEYIHD